jgi:tRNA U34 5-methylaminomethyl-2-thiouridine-forming methyltransferase MnmC
VTDDAAYSLVTLANGSHSLHSRVHQETFHPVIGPVAEAEALYVRQVRLIDRVRRQAGDFVIWDVGLGAAANALTVLRATQDIPCSIQLLSFDATVEPLRFALRHRDSLGYFDGFEPRLEALLRDRQVSYLHDAQQVRWELHLADFPSLLAEPKACRFAQPHLILFDPFSPAKNPEMWTLPLFTGLFRLLDPGRPCALPSFSRSTLFRVTLLLAGFFVGVGQGSGRKAETTLAANKLALITEPLDRRWLERARRSGSAEPLREPRYRQAPLSPGTWEQLRRHPQFG